MLRIGFWVTAVLSVLMGLVYSAIYWLPALGDLLNSDLSHVQRFIDRSWAAAWPWSLFLPGLCLAIGITLLTWKVIEKRQTDEPEPGERRTPPVTVRVSPKSGFDQILADSNREVERPRAVSAELPSWATDSQPAMSAETVTIPSDIHRFDQQSTLVHQSIEAPTVEPQVLEAQDDGEHSEMDDELPVIAGEIASAGEPEAVNECSSEDSNGSVSDGTQEPQIVPESEIPGLEEVKRFLADRSTLADMGSWVEALVDEVQEPFEKAVRDGSFDVGADANVVRIMYLRMVAAVAETRMSEAQRTAFESGVRPEIVDLVLARPA